MLAHAVSAPHPTVDPSMSLHSLHGHFLRPTTPGEECALDVERVRDGRTFASREMTTSVNGREIFRMLASFQVPEPGDEYQVSMAEVPGPTDGPTPRREGPFDMVELGPSEVRADGTYASTRRAWMRCVAPVLDDPSLHAATAAYGTDMTRRAFRPGSMTAVDGASVASLDHSIWFHRPCDISEGAARSKLGWIEEGNR